MLKKIIYFSVMLMASAPISWAQEDETEPPPLNETVTTPAATRQRVIKLTPEIRVIEKAKEVPTIPREAIQQFLIRPRIISPEEVDSLGYIVASAEPILNATVGMDIYVRGLDLADEAQNYIIIALGHAFRDQDGEVLAYEINYLGDAAVKKRDFKQDLDSEVEIPQNLTTLEITKANREIRSGDRILPIEEFEFPEDFYPHTPKYINDNSYIIGVVDQVVEIGQYQIVIINQGADDGIERGHMLIVKKMGRRVEDKLDGQNTIQLPGKKAGTVLVFKAFDDISYALVMEATLAINVFDKVTVP
ncbi:MAG: hypothetical protein SVR94_02945 [Pseudomonadota bacterium]|nr:hypothetical protein [Pseudomonadota bacterium]